MRCWGPDKTNKNTGKGTQCRFFDQKGKGGTGLREKRAPLVETFAGLGAGEARAYSTPKTTKYFVERGKGSTCGAYSVKRGFASMGRWFRKTRKGKTQVVQKKKKKKTNLKRRLYKRARTGGLWKKTLRGKKKWCCGP